MKNSALSTNELILRLERSILRAAKGALRPGAETRMFRFFVAARLLELMRDLEDAVELENRFARHRTTGAHMHRESNFSLQVRQERQKPQYEERRN